MCILQRFMFNTLRTFTNWQQIRSKLTKMMNSELTSEQISKCLLKFRFYSSSQGGFGTLAEKYMDNSQLLVYKNELPSIFSKIAGFMLKEHNQQIPLFKENQNKSYTFKKQQILYIYCMMVLNLIPKQQYHSDLEQRNRFSHLTDFSYIFSSNPEKTKAVLQYIKRQIDDAKSYDDKMTIQRVSVNQSIEQIVERQKNDKMCEVEFKKDTDSIQDSYGQLKVDFANKYIGGGALGSGCVQEEIMFINHPELYTSQLLCERMNPNEALYFTGFKKYFKTKNYGWQTTFDGLEEHKYAFDQQKRAKQYITAIDAVPTGKNDFDQFSKLSIDRQILKAYCGFNFAQKCISSVVTGNWGCGAFGGNLRLKFLIQWIACSLSHKKLIYCPFGESKIIYDQQIFKQVLKLSIGQFYEKLMKASENLCNIKDSTKYTYTIYDKLKQVL